MANGFKFSLEKLLEMRKTREEEGKKLFNNSQQELQKSINKLNDLNDKYKQYNGISAGETVIYQKLKKNYLIALNKGIEQTEIEIEKKQKEVDKAARAIIDEVTEQTIISIEGEINKYIDGINQKIERDVLKQKAILEKSLYDIKIDISIEENNRSRDIESLEQDLKVIREFRNDNLV